MPTPPKVSVIIPTYNRAHFIREAIQSVLAQTYADYEIIVVDDGSTDNTKDVLRTYGDKLKYFYQNNRGPAAARNLGISKSEGKYIAFLDSDDVWMPNRLEVQVPVLDDNPDLAFICSDARVVDSRGREINIWRKSKNNNETFESLREENFISTLTVLMRRTCFNAVGGFDENLPCVVDYDLWLRLAKNFKFLYLNELLANHRVHQGNISRNTVLRTRAYKRILLKKEIWDTMNPFYRNIRFAKISYHFATAFYEMSDHKGAFIYYLKAALRYPLIGIYVEPHRLRYTRLKKLLCVFDIYVLILETALRRWGRMNAFISTIKNTIKTQMRGK